jgi:hypothetical protein
MVFQFLFHVQYLENKIHLTSTISRLETFVIFILSGV